MRWTRELELSTLRTPSCLQGRTLRVLRVLQLAPPPPPTLNLNRLSIRTLVVVLETLLRLLILPLRVPTMLTPTAAPARRVGARAVAPKTERRAPASNSKHFWAEIGNGW